MGCRVLARGVPFERFGNGSCRCRYSTVYELSPAKLGSAGFDLIFMGHHSGVLRPSGYAYDRAILRAVK
jgi:hypothetical protein